MGLTITGETKVYRQDKVSQAGNAYTQYSLSVSSKDNAFYTVSEYNGKKQYKVFVMDFEVVEPGEGQPAPAQDTSFMQIPTDMGDLPFR